MGTPGPKERKKLKKKLKDPDRDPTTGRLPRFGSTLKKKKAEAIIEKYFLGLGTKAINAIIKKVKKKE